jgi:hypothetical protein
VFFRLLVVHVDARGPGAAGGEVPGQAGQGDQLVKLPGGRAAVPGEVKPTEGVAEEVHEGDRVGDILSGVFNANEGELVQGLACEGPGRGAIRASLVAGAAAWPAIFAIFAICHLCHLCHPRAFFAAIVVAWWSVPPGDGALGRFLSPYPGAKEERNSKEQRAKANHWGYTECPDPSRVCIYVGDGVGMHMEYVLEEIVGGRTGLAGSDSVPYVLDEVRVGGDMSGVPLGVPGVLTGGLFEEMVLEDARERLMSQYGASGVGGLVAAWRGPVIGGGRRGRMDGTGEELKGEMQSVNHVYCVSVHGKMRRELRLWRLACGDDGVQCCHVVSHEVPVEAVCASHTGEGAEEGAQSGESAVLVAVRSISSVVYYRVLYEKSKRGRGAGGRLVRLEGGVGAGGHGTVRVVTVRVVTGRGMDRETGRVSVISHGVSFHRRA